MLRSMRAALSFMWTALSTMLGFDVMLLQLYVVRTFRIVGKRVSGSSGLKVQAAIGPNGPPRTR
jgi:hypothetical protein